MADGTIITLISLAVTMLFMLGVPVLLVIAYWVIGCSFVLGLTLDNMGAELLNVFNKGYALLAMPLFILTGDLINKSGIAKRLSDFAYACLGWLRGGLAMASIGACGLFAAISGSNSFTRSTMGWISLISFLDLSPTKTFNTLSNNPMITILFWPFEQAYKLTVKKPVCQKPVGFYCLFVGNKKSLVIETFLLCF